MRVLHQSFEHKHSVEPAKTFGYIGGELEDIRRVVARHCLHPNPVASLHAPWSPCFAAEYRLQQPFKAAEGEIAGFRS